jgi:hypothetical protein
VQQCSDFYPFYCASLRTYSPPYLPLSVPRQSSFRSQVQQLSKSWARNGRHYLTMMADHTTQIMTRRLVLFLFSFLTFFVMPSVQDMVQTYCSPQNTGSQSYNGSNLYNSNGACSTACRASFAYAVVQGPDCWCSNFAPGSQLSVSSCNQKCPGYPYEYCGQQSGSLFGYIALDKLPSGTVAASPASSPVCITQPPVFCLTPSFRICPLVIRDTA